MWLLVSNAEEVTEKSLVELAALLGALHALRLVGEAYAVLDDGVGRAEADAGGAPSSRMTWHTVSTASENFSWMDFTPSSISSCLAAVYSSMNSGSDLYDRRVDSPIPAALAASLAVGLAIRAAIALS